MRTYTCRQVLRHCPERIVSGTFFALLPCDLVRSVVVQTRRRIACALFLFLFFPLFFSLLFFLSSFSLIFFLFHPLFSLFFPFPSFLLFSHPDHLLFYVIQWSNVFAAIISILPRLSLSFLFFFLFLLLSLSSLTPSICPQPFCRIAYDTILLTSAAK